MQDEPRLADLELSDVGATSLVTLYCRAHESSSDAPLLHDPHAVLLTRALSPLLRASDAALHQRLASGRLDPGVAVYVALRARRIDHFVRDFRARCPAGYVVNLGCGFDTRFHRIDDGRVLFFDVDRPEIIRIKRRLLPATERYRYIAASVLDADWMARLPPAHVPALFLAEGLLMYLPAEDVRTLVLRLRDRARRSELVAEVFHQRWLQPWLRWMVDLKLRTAFAFGPQAVFRSGLSDSRGMEPWGRGIEFVADWSFCDEDDPKLGLLRSLRHVEFLRRVQWIVHYRLMSATDPRKARTPTGQD